MEKYTIKEVNKDFIFLDVDCRTGGDNNNRIGVDRKKQYVVFKTNDSVCGEKIASSIGSFLGLNMSHVELAIDGSKVGLLYYSFTIDNSNHTDMIMYFNDYENRNKYYTLDEIKKSLDQINPNLFSDFVRMTLFDALIGNNRKEDNWGYLEFLNKYTFSPLYSNKILFKDESEIYKDDETKYTYNELVRTLSNKYPEIVNKEIKYYKRLDKKILEDIVGAIPDIFLSLTQKDEIILNILKRRNNLIEIMREVNVYV